MAENMKLGFNLGSGQRPFTSFSNIKWVNVDSQGKWKPDIVCDASHLIDEHGSPVQNDTADYVVLHHVLEHFGCGEAAGLIKEAHRVLKPGGSLHVYVPDIHALAQAYLTGRLTTQIYVTNLYGAYMGNEEDRHKWGFDQESLRTFLQSQADWFAVQRPQFDPPGAVCAHDFWILEVECVK